MAKKVMKFVLGALNDVHVRAKKGGKCGSCGSSNTVMADSGKGWGCQDCGNFTDKD